VLCSTALALSLTFVFSIIDEFFPLHRIHEAALHAVEDHHADDEQHAHEDEAVAEIQPREEALSERGILEGLDDGGDGVEQHQRAQFLIGHHAQRIDNGGGIHPQLYDEAEKHGEVAIFGGERRHDDAESQSQSGEHQDVNGEQQQRAVGTDVVAFPHEVEIDGEHQQELHAEFHEIGNDRGNGHHHSGEIHFAKHALVGRERGRRAVQTRRKIQPTNVAREIEQRLRHAVGAHLGDATKHHHIHDDGEHGLYDKPQRAEDGLLVLHDDVALHKQRHQISVAPNLSQVHTP